MNINMKEIEKGDFLKCVNNANRHWWKQNKKYKVEQYNYGELFITDEEGDVRKGIDLDDVLNHQEPLKFELIKKENNMQEFKVGDLVEVISNTSWAVNEIGEPYNKGDLAIITNVYSTTVRLGNNPYANLIKKTEIKKVEPTPELTECEKELVLILEEYFHLKNTYLSQIQKFKNNIKFNENELEKVSKKIEEIEETLKKLLTK